MQKLSYNVEGYISVYNPETGYTEQVLSLAHVVVDNPTEQDITHAEEVAYNGEYSIEGDPEPKPDTVSTDDILNALLGVTV